MSVRQIQVTYTRSEMAIIGWRSSEMSFNMKQDRKTASSQASQPRTAQEYTSAREAEIEARLGPDVIKKMQNEKGEIDLRKLTGPEMLRYMGAMQINLGRT